MSYKTEDGMKGGYIDADEQRRGCHCPFRCSCCLKDPRRKVGYSGYKIF